MDRAMDETQRRRAKQITFNTAHGITPQTIKKAVADIMEGALPGAPKTARAYARVAEEIAEYADLTPQQMARKIKSLEKEMYQHARDLEFEKAAAMRDKIKELQGKGLAA
jgi:excinuclease ABC subunit B